MKMMHGAFFLPCSNRSRTREAPTPTNISTKSEPEIEKNGTFASPAMARARRVLPVPGGPMSSTPFGILPPSFVNFCGSLRNSMISWSSTFASSTPATSLNVTFFAEPLSSFALDLPNDMALLPPACIWRMKKTQRPIRKRNGAQVMSAVTKEPSRSGSNSTTTPLSSSRLYSSSGRVLGPVAVKGCAPPGAVALVSPRISPSLMVTFWTTPWFTRLMNVLYSIFSLAPLAVLKRFQRRNTSTMMTTHRSAVLTVEFNELPPT